MEFVIARASQWGLGDAPPCDGAYRDRILVEGVYGPYPERRLRREWVDAWTIELDSIEALVDLQAELGYNVIVGPVPLALEYWATVVLEGPQFGLLIHDDYIE